MSAPTRVSRLPHLGENLCWLCWEDRTDGRQPQQLAWRTKVARWLGNPDDLHRAEMLLGDQVSVTSSEIARLAEATDLDEQDLGFSRLAEARRLEFPRLNLERLLKATQPSTKSELASLLGVHPSTFSRWLKGQTPDRSARRALCAHFGLRSESDIVDEPLFLSYLPLTHGERMNWVKTRVAEVSPSGLREVFPALVRLLS